MNTQESDKKLKNQLHRIQGQLGGVEKMIDECRNCEDVIMQLMAARSSIEKVAVKLIEEETEACTQSNDKKELERLSRLASTLFKYT